MNAAHPENQVLNGTANGIRFSFLAPVARPSLDYMTSTFAVRSSCQLTSQRCELELFITETFTSGHRKGLRFRCSNDFFGRFIDNGTYMNGKPLSRPSYASHCNDNGAGCVEFLEESTLEKSLNPINNSYTLNTTTQRYANPFYAGVLGASMSNSTWSNLSEEFTRYSDLDWFVLKCDVAVFDLKYSWVNSSITAANLTHASDEIAAIMRSGLVASPAKAELAYAVQLAVSESQSADEFVVKYAERLEKMLLAFSGGVWEPLETLDIQSREPILVARVPKAPLYVFVLLCLISFCLVWSSQQWL